MSTYKLYYFNGRGRAEFARLVFAAAGEKYEDVRFEREKWPEHKSEMPLGQVPVLEYNGERIPQSIAIARFLAKQFHLAGKDHFEQAKADAVVDTVNDALVKYIPARFESDEKEKEEALKKFFDDELPKHLQNLEVLGKTYGEGSAFFVGNQLTWADLFFYEVSQTLVNSHGDCLDKYPWLKQNRAEVEKNPRIAEYLKSRPETPF